VTGSIGISLGITAIGMTLLFLALAFFYGLLSFMTAAMQERRVPPPAGRQAAGAAEGAPGKTRRRAAAIAVALARAEAEAAATRPATGSSDPQAANQVSAWWSLHHQRQISVTQGGRRSR
jgi:Na+-transporting methylmalonyl-CoA/oxaloacetate decarboxylase gamma subunit